jgi:hypothetical protein
MNGFRSDSRRLRPYEKREQPTVSYLEVPPFDLLTNQPSPYESFGRILPASETVERAFEDVVGKARERIGEAFGVRIGQDREGIQELEDLIAEMWAQDWNPEEGDVNLFATDFGSLFTRALSRVLKGRLVFRSEKDLSHLSCWWEPNGVEAFPFHKVYKRLLSQEGESLPFFFSALESILQP